MKKVVIWWKAGYANTYLLGSLLEAFDFANYKSAFRSVDRIEVYTNDGVSVYKGKFA